ncbi:MAG TPA: hypothetical protein VFT34_14115 [Verrucomicrobiae bacterium]|nr:hypothetical protein [Verrucomicrobiae bacterium]
MPSFFNSRKRRHERLLQETFAARHRFFSSLGEVQSDGIGKFISSRLSGGPSWPSGREFFLVIKRGNHTMLASDGLSDPFDEGDADDQGFGLEFIIESSDPVPVDAASWASEILDEICLNAADVGDLRSRFERLGLMTMELPWEQSWEGWTNEHQRLGILLGSYTPGLPKTFALPKGDALLITIKLLRPAELKYAIEYKQAGRERLAELFCAAGSCHVCSLNRPSVI